MALERSVKYAVEQLRAGRLREGELLSILDSAAVRVSGWVGSAERGLELLGGLVRDVYLHSCHPPLSHPPSATHPDDAVSFR